MTEQSDCAPLLDGFRKQLVRNQVYSASLNYSRIAFVKETRALLDSIGVDAEFQAIAGISREVLDAGSEPAKTQLHDLGPRSPGRIRVFPAQQKPAP
jgi:hypothetical protein